MTIAQQSQFSVLMCSEDKDKYETEDENEKKECRTQDL
jgi:hypothetical protein